MDDKPVVPDYSGTVDGFADSQPEINTPDSNIIKSRKNGHPGGYEI
jgi:hypothetical protein